MLRCFFAVPLPDPLVAAVAPVLAAVPVGHQVPPENLHLTLAFLGEQPDSVLATADEAMQAIAAPAFDLRLQGLGTFGDPRPHTVWAGVGDPAPFEALHTKVLGALRNVGVVLPRRRFRPHLTLARLPRLDLDDEARLAGFLSRWHDFPCPDAPVTRFALYRSILGRGAPVYRIMAEYPLG